MQDCSIPGSGQSGLHYVRFCFGCYPTDAFLDSTESFIDVGLYPDIVEAMSFKLCSSIEEKVGNSNGLVQLELACKIDGVASPDPVCLVIVAIAERTPPPPWHLKLVLHLMPRASARFDLTIDWSSNVTTIAVFSRFENTEIQFILPSATLPKKKKRGGGRLLEGQGNRTVKNHKQGKGDIEFLNAVLILCFDEKSGGPPRT